MDIKEFINEFGISIERMRELAQAEQDGRLVVLEGCDKCYYKMESEAWKYYVYPCNECQHRVPNHFRRGLTREAAEAALQGGDMNVPSEV